MKYPQSLQMPRVVEDWLEEQLEARGIDAVIYSRYIVNLFQQNAVDDSHKFLPYVTSQLKKYDIETLVEELCAKLKEIENKDSSQFEIPPPQPAGDASPIDTALNYYAAFPTVTGGTETSDHTKSHSPPYSVWARGLLHDSMSDNSKDIMEDYFSTFFYGNPTDDFGFGFTRNNSDERQDGGDETERINFYNKQNLLASESDRVYERNPDVEKLIAKFDANIEDIWKPIPETEDFYNSKNRNLFSHNVLSNSYIQYGSNFIWSFKENESKEKEAEKEVPTYRSTFFNWNKISPPTFSSPSCGVDGILNAVNMLSNIKKWSAMDGQDKGSNLSLNHNKNSSCFTEVVPKGTGSELSRNLYPDFASETVQNRPEEEDLLTSAKTHFRPIRMEELQSNQTTVYADGTTFAISNELEKVSFKRSESGTLYLDEDADVDAPRKYMEYKEKETHRYTDSESDLSSMEEFVPKFRVRQSNEKCCQTEEIIEDQMVPSVNDTDCESDDYESEADEFFFPGDEELAQNIINSLDEEKTEVKKPKPDCNYNEIYVMDNEGMEVLEINSFKKPNFGECECGIGKKWQCNWENLPKAREEWSEIWSPQNPCDTCKANARNTSTKDKYCRFREELTQDGEQLLSDLSCLQQLYSNSDWCDDDSTSASDFNDDELPNEEILAKDGFFTTEALDNLNNVKKDPSWRNLWATDDEKPKKDIDFQGIWSNEKSIPNVFKGDGKINEINERPFIADLAQKERKRRNSSSQKACNLYMEGQCRRPHCRFAHTDSAIPCPFYADASCLKGESCPLSHGLRRPLSL